MKSVIKRLKRILFILPGLLFTVIFTAYFCSTVGLVNSGDTPQYYTAEALIRNGNVDMRPFVRDPHFFVYPDFYTRSKQILSLRGYTQSALMVPVHLVAPLIEPLIATRHFPPSVDTDNFRHELTVVSLFTLFTVLGILAVWKVMKEASGSALISFGAALLFAFGTYAWKYSAYYTRQGEEILLSGIILISLYNIVVKKLTGWPHKALFLCLAVAFGLDMVYFCAVGGVAGMVVTYELYRSRGKRIRGLLVEAVPALLVLGLIMYLDWRWYGNILPSQYQQSFQFNGIPMSERLRVMASAPLIPTLFTLLFSFGPPPPEAFTQFVNLPRITLVYTSVLFAMKYNFFGMFAVSPFLLFAFILPYKRLRKTTLAFVLLCFLLFLINVVGAAQFYVFWGGNQYDIRYVYPHAIFLLPPLAVSLGYYLRRGASVWRNMFIGIFVPASSWSLFMGWLGEINMFAPALHRERKIWLDPFTLARFPRVSLPDYWRATFMNRENILAAFFVVAFLFLIYYTVARIIFSPPRQTG